MRVPAEKNRRSVSDTLRRLFDVLYYIICSIAPEYDRFMEKAEKYSEKKKKRINRLRPDRNAIRLLAAAAMTLNHAAAVFLPEGSFWWALLTYAGYLTAPVMCWFVVEGWHHTRDVRRYAGRLLTFALLAQLPYMGALQLHNGNVLFTLLACLLIVDVMHTEVRPERRMLLLLLLAGATAFCDWSCLLAGAAVLFARSRGSRAMQKQAWGLFLAVFALSVFSGNLEQYSLPAAIGHTLGAMCGPLAGAILVLYLYDADRPVRRTAFSRWFFYLYYPLHLAILWALRAGLS